MQNSILITFKAQVLKYKYIKTEPFQLVVYQNPIIVFTMKIPSHNHKNKQTV